MINNDVLRRVRYIFDYSDAKMIALFGQADHKVTRQQISSWLKKDEDAAFVECSDVELAIFLNGLINDRRGKKEGVPAVPESRLTNNVIFNKLKIALNLRADDVLSILALGGSNISQHELSAFFRKPTHRHYRICQDQILRNFLHGLQRTYRPDTDAKKSFIWADALEKSVHKPGEK